MNARTIALIGLVAIMGIGLIMLIGDLFKPKAQPVRMSPAYAAVQIEPYTVITQDMIRSGESISAREAVDAGAYPVESVVGLMTTAQISPGDQLTGGNARPVEEVRFVEELGLEVVSFQAGVDRTVGGKLRKGHIVNLYGYGRGEDNEPFTTLIEPQLWVVDVSASGRPVTSSTPEIDPITGEFKSSGGVGDQPASLITVAAEPAKIYHIVDALGAKSLSPWITLAANQMASSAIATPSIATPTVGLPPDLALTATALWKQLQATQPPPPPRLGDGGSSR
jgi:hypothetical protein